MRDKLLVRYFLLSVLLILPILESFCWSQQRKSVYIEQDSDIQKQFDNLLEQSLKNATAAIPGYQEILKAGKGIVIPYSLIKVSYVLQLEKVLREYEQKNFQFQKDGRSVSPSYIEEIYQKYPPVLLSEETLQKMYLHYKREGIAGLYKAVSCYSPGEYIGVSEYARMWMANMEIQEPEESVQLSIEKASQEALKNADVLKLYGLLTENTQWICADKTMISLGNVLFSRGEIDVALGFWKRMCFLRKRKNPEELHNLNISMAMASFMTGDMLEYQRIQNLYSHDQSMIEIGGQKLPLQNYGNLVQNNVSLASPRAWLHSNGNSAHNVLSKPLDLREFRTRQKWEPYTYPLSHLVKERAQYKPQQNDRFIAIPLYQNRQLYYHLPGTLISIDMNTAKLNWQSSFVRESGLRIKGQRENLEQLIENSQSDRHLSRIYTGAISNNHLYLFSPPHTPDNKIYAINLATGKRSWQWPSQEDQKENFFFNSNPVVIDNKLFTTATVLSGQTNSELFCFELENFEKAPEKAHLRWRRFLGSVILSSYTKEKEKQFVPKASGVTACYGLVYCCTNIGVIGAVDMYNGELRWLAKYHEHVPFKYRLCHTGIKGINREAVAPIAKHGKLYVMPSDSHHLFVYNAFNGSLQKIFPEQQPESEFTGLLGIDENGNVFLTSNNSIIALREDGTQEIAWEIRLPERIQGQGILSNKWAYVLTTQSLYQIDLQNGKYYRVLTTPWVPVNARSVWIVEEGDYNYLAILGNELKIYKSKK